MATQKIGTPAPPERITDHTRNRLCTEWAALDHERLALNKRASDRKKRQDEIERLLGGQLALDGVNVIDLPRWQFGVELKAGSFSWKNELLKEIDDEELQKRVDAVPQKEDFFLREKELPAKGKKSSTVTPGRRAA